MSDRPDDHPPPPDGYDSRYNPVAFYLQLLAAHDQGVMAGRPLLTDAGADYVERVLNAERAGRPVPPPTPELPRWDGLRQLRLGRQKLLEFDRLAPSQGCVLDAFEVAGWPAGPISNPLPPEPGETAADVGRRLHETVKNLNRGLRPGTIHFRDDRARVWWERYRRRRTR